MKISVSSYSFSQQLNAKTMTQLDCVKKAAEMGFDGIEFTGIDGAPDMEEQKKNAQAIRAEADRLGLPIVAYTLGACLYADDEEKLELEIQRLKGQLDIAHILGAPVFRHDVCYELGKSGNARSFDRMLPTIARCARQVTEYGAQLGIRTCSENHGFIAQDSDRVERLFNAVAHDNYGLLVDMGNFLCVDENPATAVSRVAPYAVHAHAKDMVVREKPLGKEWIVSRGGQYLYGAVIGEGDVPVTRCLRALKKSGYEGYVTIEYEGEEDCLTGIARGLKNLRAMMATIE